MKCAFGIVNVHSSRAIMCISVCAVRSSFFRVKGGGCVARHTPIVDVIGVDLGSAHLCARLFGQEGAVASAS